MKIKQLYRCILVKFDMMRNNHHLTDNFNHHKSQFLWFSHLHSCLYKLHSLETFHCQHNQNIQKDYYYYKSCIWGRYKVDNQEVHCSNLYKLARYLQENNLMHIINKLKWYMIHNLEKYWSNNYSLSLTNKCHFDMRYMLNYQNK